MASAIVSGSSGPVSNPGREHCVVFMDKALFSHYGLASRPGEGESRNAPSGFMLQKTRISRRFVAPLGSHADFTFTFYLVVWKSDDSLSLVFDILHKDISF